MDDDYILAEISKEGRNKTRKQYPHSKIGSIIQECMKARAKYCRGYQAADVFSELLPAELSAACRVESVLSGVLRVRVLSGAYLFQMRQLCPELLKELKKQCPAAGIKYIKLVVDREKRND